MTYIDPYSLEHAQNNIKMNNWETVIETRLSEEGKILVGVLRPEESYDFCMCNPPFFENMEQTGLSDKTVCTGSSNELVTKGGELQFVGQIIKDSLTLRNRVRWYTSMIGRKVNVKLLLTELRKHGITNIRTTEFFQGRTNRWAIAWSFSSEGVAQLAAQEASKKRKFSQHTYFNVNTKDPVQLFASIREYLSSRTIQHVATAATYHIKGTVTERMWASILGNNDTDDTLYHESITSSEGPSDDAIVANNQNDQSSEGLIGPQLPSHLVSKQHNGENGRPYLAQSGPAPDDEFIGPEMPPHLQAGNAVSEGQPPQTDEFIGPAMPPHLANETQTVSSAPEELTKTDDDFIGPAIPPHLLNKTMGETSGGEVPGEDYIGPTLPPNFSVNKTPTNLQNNNNNNIYNTFTEDLLTQKEDEQADYVLFNFEIQILREKNNVYMVDVKYKGGEDREKYYEFFELFKTQIK